MMNLEKRRRASSGMGKYIKFADPEVERILLPIFSSDAIGITFEDADMARPDDFTGFRKLFEGNTLIKYFEEFQYFTYLEKRPTNNPGIWHDTYMAFRNSTLERVVLPPHIQSASAYIFGGCTRLHYLEIPETLTNIPDQFLSGMAADGKPSMIVFRSSTPPSFVSTCFWGRASELTLYVPYSADHSVLSAYQTATELLSGIHPAIAELNPDGTIPQN